MSSLIEGVVSPLLSFWRRSLVPTGALFLTACSHDSSLPPFTASGFAEDQGMVRIWRKDSGDNVYLLAVFSPWRSGDTTTRKCCWRGDNLTLINISVYNKPLVNVHACFGDYGDLNFMQRESNGERQQLSNDQIDLCRYRTDQIRQVSDALHQRRVVLRRGRWHAMKQTVTTCGGQAIKPDLDSQAVAHIGRHQSRSFVDISMAWLETPEGSQLLLVVNPDFCRWQPNEKTFWLISGPHLYDCHHRDRRNPFRYRAEYPLQPSRYLASPVTHLTTNADSPPLWRPR